MNRIIVDLSSRALSPVCCVRSAASLQGLRTEFAAFKEEARDSVVEELEELQMYRLSIAMCVSRNCKRTLIYHTVLVCGHMY